MKMLPKILTKTEKEKKEKRLKTILTVLIVVILAASTAGFALDIATKKEKKEYGEFVFSKTEDGYWKPKNVNLLTAYLPQEVENISSSGILDIEYFSNKVYFVSAQNRPAAFELIRAVPIENIQLACLPEQEDEAGCEELPLKSCEDAEFGNAVIIFNASNKTEINLINND